MFVSQRVFRLCGREWVLRQFLCSCARSSAKHGERKKSHTPVVTQGMHALFSALQVLHTFVRDGVTPAVSQIYIVVFTVTSFENTPQGAWPIDVDRGSPQVVFKGGGAMGDVSKIKCTPRGGERPRGLVFFFVIQLNSSR